MDKHYKWQTRLETWKQEMMLVTSHPASKASLKKPSEIECLAADSETLIWDNQYEALDSILNFIRLDDLEMSDMGVSLLPWPLADLLLVLVSEIGVMLPDSFGPGVADDLAGIESLLGGLADLSLPERSRTPTLLLTLEGGLTLKRKKKCSKAIED